MSRWGLAALAVVVLFGVAARASAATVNWSAPGLVDNQQPFATTPAIQSVVCPSVHLCVGLEGEGVVTASDPLGGAAAWHLTSFIGIPGYSGAGFGALACAPATRFCAAADEVGDLMTTTNPAGGAGAWKLTRLPRRVAFSALSCPTAKLCFAVDNGSVLYSRAPANARSWRDSRIVSGAVLESISCPTAHFCAATASGSITAQILTSANPTGGRGAWHATRFSWERTNLAFSSVSCPSERLCVAGDAWGDIFTSTHPGRRRRRLTRLAGHLRGFDGRNLSCPSIRLCVSVSIAGIASSTRPAGGAKTWTIGRLSTGLDGVATVGCVRSLCVAGDAGDNLLVSARPAAGVSAWGRFNLAGGSSGVPDSVSSLSCPSTSLCAGVLGSSVLTSTNPAGGTSAWGAVTLSTLTGVSCPSGNLCVAGALDGAIYTSTDPTGGAGAWSSTQLGDTPTECGKYGCSLDPITAVSCASAQLCTATDGSHLWSSTDPGTPSAAWTKSPMPFSAGVLTCSADNLCVSANGEQIDANTDPSSPSPTWIATELPTVTGVGESGAPSTGFVSSVSCPSTQLCVAVDDVAGYAFTGNPTEPGSWTATKIDSPLSGFPVGARALTGVSCPPSGACVAVDAAGNVILGRVSG